MSLVFSITSAPSCVILHLSGRIVSDELLPEIIHTVEREISAGTINVIFDLEKLEYCNSTGLNLFVRTLTKTRNAGGDCVLVNLQLPVSKLFELSKLNEIFTAFNSVNEAKERYNTIA